MFWHQLNRDEVTFTIRIYLSKQVFLHASSSNSQSKSRHRYKIVSKRDTEPQLVLMGIALPRWHLPACLARGGKAAENRKSPFCFCHRAWHRGERLSAADVAAAAPSDALSSKSRSQGTSALPSPSQQPPMLVVEAIC